MTRRAYFDKGMNQTYSQSEQKESGVDTGKYGKSGLSYKGSAPNTYPVVILLEACGECRRMRARWPAKATAAP